MIYLTKKRLYRLSLVFALIVAGNLYADEQRSLDAMASWVGLELHEVLERFGPPLSVYPLRGQEAWQDDVVFEYPKYDLFIYKNRVWQLRFYSLVNIPEKATASVVKALLGQPLFDHASNWIYQLGGEAWPLRLRVNFNPAPQENSLDCFYLYRADF